MEVCTEWYDHPLTPFISQSLVPPSRPVPSHLMAISIVRETTAKQRQWNSPLFNEFRISSFPLSISRSVTSLFAYSSPSLLTLAPLLSK